MTARTTTGGPGYLMIAGSAAPETLNDFHARVETSNYPSLSSISLNRLCDTKDLMSSIDRSAEKPHASLFRLAKALGVEMPTVANWHIVPRGLVLEMADQLGVNLGSGTAEHILRELIDTAGLLSASGLALTFRRGFSASIAGRLAEIISERKNLEKRLIIRSKPSKLADPNFETLNAKSKLEAINRISMLTDSGPETLGPGSKERKSVLLNLNRGLGFGSTGGKSKTQLAESIANRIGVEWDTQCWSAGETITLQGLNRLLLGATRALRRDKGEVSIKEETSMYAGVILESILDESIVNSVSGSVQWDGRRCIERMVRNKYSNARQTEWPGFYFEFSALPALRGKYGGGPIRYGSTIFDYNGQRTWDLKTHSSANNKSHYAPLNDSLSIQEAVKDGGLGFIVLSGEPVFENEQEFYEWHNYELRKNARSDRSRNSRRLKTGFNPMSIDFIFIENLESLEYLKQNNIIRNFNQGRQQGGASRKMKYSLDLAKAIESDAWKCTWSIPHYVRSLTSNK